jgi:PAS domain S-box-containing protein
LKEGADMMSYKRQFVFLSICLMVCGAFIFSIYTEIKKHAVQELNNRQTVYARLAAKGIENDFDHKLNTLSYLAADEHIIRLDRNGKNLLTSFQTITGNHVRGVSRVDARGKIIFSWPDVPGTVGSDISAQPHMQKVLQTRRPVISDIFKAVQSYDAIAIHVPVYRGETFDGTVGFLVSFDDLAKTYLADLHTDKYRYAQLISEQGTIIYCSVTGHQGRSAFEAHRNAPEYLAMLGEMIQGKDGIATYRDFTAAGHQDGSRRHAVYLPVRVGDTHWSILVSTSEDFLFAILKGSRNHILLLSMILLLVFAAIGYGLMRYRSESLTAQKRRQIEEDLVASAREIHDLYHNAPCGYHSLDADGNIVRINDTELSWLGYTREELIGQPYTRILAESSRETFLSAFARLKEQGIVRNVEYTMLSNDASNIPVLVTASAVTDDQGRFVMTRSMVMDITSRRKDGERLRESEVLYRTALENTSDGIIITDIETGQYLYVNSRLMNTIGRPDENVIGKKADIYLHPDDIGLGKKYLKARKKGNPNAASYEARAIKPDSSVVHLSVNATEIIFQGKPAVISFLTDITEQKRAENALRESEERYRSIIENIDDDYFESDLKGNITFLNKPFSWTGHKREDIIGTNHSQYTTPEVAGRINAAFNEVYRSGKPARVLDCEMFRRDNSIGHMEMSASLIRDAQGNPTGFRGISRDVSDRFRMEEEHKKLTGQLYQAQKMEAIGTLAGGIAHDFNNLLMGIQGYTSLMLLEVDATHPYYGQLTAIQTLVQSGANVTKQLLGFARAGRYEVVPVNLNDLVGKAVGLFGRTRKEILIFEKYAENIWIVEADRGQLEQVMLNLFVNAWQAMPGGGSLYLETENVVFDIALAKTYDLMPGRYVKISVTDTGVGMDANIKQRIFDPFFTTKEMGRGTGLGLASAYGIIKGHGGTINVYSEKGQGTTFNLYLPATSNTVVCEEPSERVLTGGRETILLVDDETVITEVTGRLLEELGYTVLTATSGDEAVAVYTRKHADIDLVIVDMIMPGMSGSDTFDALKAVNPSVRVILSSGYSLNGKAQAIMEKGARTFLQKPYRLDDLSQKIREALSD